MKPILLLLVFACVGITNAQTIKNHMVVIGNTDSVQSKILKEKRTVWIYLPGDYETNTKGHYPVIYLLDAEWNFSAFSGMVHELSEVIGNTVLPPPIIVAIPNTDRTRDLTPTNSEIDADGSRATDQATSGGGENFTAFIKNELMPHIDSVYRTAPYKTLVGHSFGGLTAMNIIINHTEMFNSYVVIDPSMWWDKGKLLNQAREAFKLKRFEGKSMYLAIANTMAEGMDTARVQKDTAGVTTHIRSILELKNILQHNPQNGLNWTYKYYSTDTHGSVPLIAEYDAIHFLFNFYNMPSRIIAVIIDKKSKTDVAALIDSHYEDVSRHMGYRLLPSEDMLTGIGYFLLSTNQPEKAYAIFNLNIKDYPDSFNVYNVMGDYYDNQKNKAKAIEYYTQSLKLKENPDTRKKLEKLVALK